MILQTLLLPLSNSNFWGFPLSQVSVVLPSAKNVVNAFVCFVLSPIVAVAKTNYSDRHFQNLDAKVTYWSSFLTSAFLSRHLSTSIQHLHSSCWTTFPTSNLYTCIYYNKHRAISTKQTYISKTDGDTDRITDVRNFLRNKLLEIGSFYKNRRIDKDRKNRDEETK